MESLLGDLLNRDPGKVVFNVDNKSAKVDVEYVSTEDQLADILTKPLGRVKFLEMRKRIGLRVVKEPP